MLVYVSGPYRGDVKANIETASQVAAQLWEIGHAVICPHANTAHFEERCTATWEDYIRGDLNMITRCDALVMLPNWQESPGAVVEHGYATGLGVPIYFAPDLPPLHPAEVRCPVQAQAFRECLGRMYRLHLDKNADYSPANIMGTGEIGLITRLWDKMARLMNLTGFRITISESKFTAPLVPKNESVDDTLLDLANYGVIGYLLRQQKWGI